MERMIRCADFHCLSWTCRACAQADEEDDDLDPNAEIDLEVCSSHFLGFEMLNTLTGGGEAATKEEAHLSLCVRILKEKVSLA